MKPNLKDVKTPKCHENSVRHKMFQRMWRLPTELEIGSTWCGIKKKKKVLEFPPLSFPRRCIWHLDMFLLTATVGTPTTFTLHVMGKWDPYQDRKNSLMRCVDLHSHNCMGDLSRHSLPRFPPPLHVPLHWPLTFLTFRQQPVLFCLLSWALPMASVCSGRRQRAFRVVHLRLVC